jgi:N-sulfoglucosamine sulfohydrolase
MKEYKRREFLKAMGLGAFAMVTTSRLFAEQKTDNRPNILWILSEDISPELSCYGTPLVQTPNLDRLASQGIRFTNAFTTAPVCSASRSAMITGMFQTTIGAHNHRSHRDDGYTLPEPVCLITEYFRRAGYFTANVTTAAPGVRGSGKTDFNFKFEKAFDGKDWNQRKPGQPFFAQLSISVTHRGGHWKNLPGQIKSPVDPDKVKLPPYYPDHSVARQDWATYLDSIQVMDGYMGKILKRLDDENLAGNTVVIFIGDHGRCHVRGKQWLYDGGIHIPLLVRWPDKIRAGQVCDDLVSAIDISATILKIAGIEPPEYMEGKVFLEPGANGDWRPVNKHDYIVAARDRCDETIDRIRCVRTKQFKYIRNFLPDRPYTQRNDYKERPVRNQQPRIFARISADPKKNEGDSGAVDRRNR